MKKLLLTLLTAFIFIITSCIQEPNGVTSIEVLLWESDERIETITDKKFISELAQKLETAETSSTTTMDFVSPEYKLLFKKESEVLYELGYYKKAMKLGVEGHYWNFPEDEMIGVMLELPNRK
ncbi:hypothetical protein [Bacillus sp. Marseille-Q3570]|uniref:hypothetical protein n=1 Tax=Bacillus sp. Marseille-Q3570 TaxID=2963522 RepID=UPI0021B78C12|nr:hypothetical protein [Bacillus sp. Marseille-Q3570]